MLLLAKVALGITSTLAVGAAYTFHEGLIHVDVDEARPGGTHMHLWVPATVVPVALHFAPRQNMREAAERAKPFLPALRVLSRQLEKYPDAEFVEVQEGSSHVQVHTQAGSIRIDVEEPGETVHLRVPASTIGDLVGELEADAPAE